MSNPLTQALQGVTDPTPTSQANPLTAALRGGADNPLTAAISDSSKPAPVNYAAAARAAGDMSSTFDVRHPVIGAIKNFIVEQVHDAGAAMWFAATHPIPKEGHGDSPQAVLTASRRMLSDLQAMSPEDASRVQRGTALVMSFGVGSAGSEVARVAGGRYIGRIGAFLSGEFLGGSVYGATEPIDPEESRVANILSQGSQFAVAGAAFGGTLHLTGRAFKRYVLAMPRAKRIEAARIIRQGLDQVDEQLRAAGTSLDALPDNARMAVENRMIKNAVEQTDPAAILDLDQAIVKEAQRAMESTPRFDKPNRLGDIEPPPGERELDLPDTPFNRLLEQSKPLEVPAVTRDVGQVPGFIEGAGKPERLVEQPWAEVVDPKTGTVLQSISRKQAEAADWHHNMQIKPELMARVDSGELKYELLGDRAQPEYVVSAAVRGNSGKIYQGATHPQAMADAMDAGVPVHEFEMNGEQWQRNRGFATNKREWIAPAEASELADRLAGMKPRSDPNLDASDLYQTQAHPGLIPIDARDVAGVEAESVAHDVTRGAFEPQSVHLPVPPPKGFEPTAVGAEAEGSPGIVERLALADAAVDEAVARIEPMEISTPEVRSEATLVQELVGDPIEPGRGSDYVAEALTRALEKEPVAAEAQVVLDLSHPQPWEIPLDRKVSPKQAAAVKKGIAKAMEREIAPIEIEASEQVRATWNQPLVDRTVAPPLDGWEIAVRLDDKGLNAIADKIADLGRQGAILPGLMGRIAVGGAGVTMETIAYDDDTPPAVAAGLHVLGGFLILAAAHPAIKALATRTKWMRSLIEQYNPTYLMSSHGKEAFRQAVENMTNARAFAHGQFQIIERMFESTAAKRSLMFVLDEGSTAPEWHLLTPHQQALAVNLHQLNLRMGQMLKASGIIDEYVENYVRHLLPPESFQRWRVNGYRTFQTGGAFTQRRHILTLRDLETWAKNEGVPGPVMDPAYVHQHHLIEAYRSLGNARLRTALEGLGLIQKAPASPFTSMPADWRQLRIAGMGDKLAPNPVAQALENMSSPGATVEWLNGFDTIKSWWMRSVMFWFWEHGLNVLRSLPAVSLDPTGFGTAWKAIKQNDPALREAASWGVDLFSRPDYGARSAQNFQALLKKVSNVSPALGAPALKGLAWLTNKNDKILWDQIVPSLQLFAWQTEMSRWADRTAGKFLKGTSEYTAAARKAADYANNVAGRVPQELTDPKLAQGMRLLLFSPQWTMSRIALTAHAAGELSNALNATSAAEISNAIKSGTYLPFKVRQLAVGIAATWLISKALSGKEPEFNPNTQKFYARTGLRNAKGREMGLDMLGWWQGDLQAFSNVWGYFENRLNPALKVIQETVTGRDFAGRSMTGMEKISNIFQSFGPPSEALSLGARAITPGPPISGGEALSRISGMAATGNVAALPRPMDVVIARLSKRLLRKQGISANDDTVFELSRLLRSNLLSGRDMIDDQVVNYLAYRRRSQQVASPGSGAIGYLWQEARRVLSDF